MLSLNNDWDTFLAAEMAKPYYLQLRAFLKQEYATQTVYPPMYDLFNALRFSSIEQTKVVILGQDPYINHGEAHGLAFSVKPPSRTPPSLQNIFKEIAADVGCAIPNNGHLVKWCEQGVMLLNSVLSVRAGQSKSHAGKGWEQFTTAVIQRLNEKATPTVFLLWGNDAKSKGELVTNPAHLVLQAAHPSPLARGAFFGCKHFSRTNAFLEGHGMSGIDWQVEDV
ncbi:MAG: uracil-DNA glycosylase [Oscillospiraceae bacterium]|nr:uracil-DNA glycosylase [Oscillospiraceae bacterium]